MLVLHKGLLGLPLEIFICRENILHHCANSRVVMLKFYPVLDGYVLFSVNIRKYVRILLKTGQKKKKREKSSDALNTFLVALAFQSKVNADLSRVQCATTLNESKKKKKIPPSTTRTGSPDTPLHSPDFNTTEPVCD